MDAVSGSPGKSLSDLLSHWKDLQNSEEQLYKVMVYSSERIQIQISKEKRYMGEVQEKPGASFQITPPSGVTEALASFSQ